MESSRTEAPKPTVAQLLGETPEAMKLYGRMLQLQHDSASMEHKTYRRQMRSLRAHMRAMNRMQREEVRGPMMDGWTDEEIDAYLARYGVGMCDA